MTKEMAELQQSELENLRHDYRILSDLFKRQKTTIIMLQQRIERLEQLLALEIARQDDFERQDRAAKILNDAYEEE